MARQVNSHHQRLSCGSASQVVSLPREDAPRIFHLRMFHRLLLGFLPPAPAIRYVFQHLSPVRESVVYTFLQLDFEGLEVTATPRSGQEGHPSFCAINRAILAAVTRYYQDWFLRVSPSACLSRGESVCRCRIAWQRTPAALLGLALHYGGLIAVVAGLLGVFFFPRSVCTAFLLGALVLLPALGWYRALLRNRMLHQALERLRHCHEEVVDLGHEQYGQSQLLQEVGQIISRGAGPQEMADGLAMLLTGQLDWDRGQILVVDSDARNWEAAVSFDRSRVPREIPGQPGQVLLSDPGEETLQGLCFHGQRSLRINGLEQLAGIVSPAILAQLNQQGVVALICCPIVVQEISLGVLLVENLAGSRPFQEKELALLQGIASILGMHIYHHRIRSLFS